jgi:hypothetical protein
MPGRTEPKLDEADNEGALSLSLYFFNLGHAAGSAPKHFLFCTEGAPDCPNVYHIATAGGTDPSRSVVIIFGRHPCCLSGTLLEQIPMEFTHSLRA